jgi:hypothetical protein
MIILLKSVNDLTSLMKQLILFNKVISLVLIVQIRIKVLQFLALVIIRKEIQSLEFKHSIPLAKIVSMYIFTNNMFLYFSSLLLKTYYIYSQ